MWQTSCLAVTLELAQTEFIVRNFVRKGPVQHEDQRYVACSIGVASTLDTV